MAIEWRQQYSVHEVTIDSQHRRLFEMGARLYEMAGGNADMAEYRKVLDGLAAYTHEHFSYEEAYLRRNGYSKLEQHIHEHLDFTGQVDGFMREADEWMNGIEPLKDPHTGTDGLMDIDGKAGMDDQSSHSDRIFRTILFVTEWISRHISQTDREFSKEFRRKGI